ncbi:MAG: DUF4276 family protein [Bacteroidales bacterium]|nr:DUF4276 family protein [Bacteroidales bacterium]
MTRVIVICEGETEKEFCTKLLLPFFAHKEIYIQSPLIKKTMGGIVKWTELKNQITLHLKNDPDAIVTTLIDYYGLYKKHDFPKWEQAELIADKNRKLDFLEHGMHESIDDSIRFRYIPYLQLHEFEGLLFNSIDVFYNQIPPEELIGRDELVEIFEKYNNPELINNNKSTSPSHRLSRIIKGYNKIVYGNILAEAIGVEQMRTKCPRFNNWLNKIENSK